VDDEGWQVTLNTEVRILALPGVVLMASLQSLNAAS
jgi:hypothetical protein